MHSHQRQHHNEGAEDRPAAWQLYLIWILIVVIGVLLALKPTGAVHGHG